MEIEEHQGDSEEDPLAAEISADVKTPAAFVNIDIKVPSLTLQDIESSSVSSDGDTSLEASVSTPVSAVVSPTLSTSTPAGRGWRRWGRFSRR